VLVYLGQLLPAQCYSTWANSYLPSATLYLGQLLPAQCYSTWANSYLPSAS